MDMGWAGASRGLRAVRPLKATGMPHFREVGRVRELRMDSQCVAVSCFFISIRHAQVERGSSR